MRGEETAKGGPDGQPAARLPKVLIFSPVGQVYGHDKVRWYNTEEEELLGKYFNVGDMMVYDSTLKMLDFAKATPLRVQGATEEQIEEFKTYDCVVVRASNFVHNSQPGVTTWGDAAEMLERIKLPIYAVGVGAQAADDTVYRLEGPNLHFWSLVAERSKIVGVRGEYTRQVLEASGIHNVEIVGCPSMFRQRKRDLQVALPEDLRRVAFSLRREVAPTYSSNRHRYLRLQRSLLMKTAEEFDATVTFHGEVPERAYFYGHTEKMKEAREGFLKNGWWTEAIAAKMEAIYRNSFFFTEVEKYDEFIRTQQFAFGYRVHGILPALANGVAAAAVRYDSRSSELADTHDIPSFSAADIEKRSLREAFSELDFSRFNAGFQQRYDTMKRVLVENGISTRL